MLRDGLADMLDWIAIQVWRAAHRLRPVYKGPVCPDCEIAPDPGDGGICETCEAKVEQDLRENSIFDAGAREGYRQAFKAIEGE